MTSMTSLPYVDAPEATRPDHGGYGDTTQVPQAHPYPAQDPEPIRARHTGTHRQEPQGAGSVRSGDEEAASGDVAPDSLGRGRWGKANGNGPLHVLATLDGETATLCGVQRFDAYLFWPDDVVRHGICTRCRAIRRDTARRPARPPGPDLVTPAIVEAHNAIQRATKEYAALLAANQRAFAWMKDFPEERTAFIGQLRAAGVTLAVIGDLLGMTRERVRQLEASC